VNRLVVVAIAAIVAIASGVGLVVYVGGAEDRAAESAQPVPVLVAAKDVADGMAFDDAIQGGLIVEAETPQALLPKSAVVDPSNLKGTVADGGLLAGQFVVDGEFVKPGEERVRTGGATFADSLTDGTVAVSFDAAGANAVSDLVRPGNRINLLVQVPDAAELGLEPTDGPAMVHVFQDLEVLAVGTELIPSGADDATAAKPVATGTYTVAASPKDAARVLLLTRQYPVFIALNAPETKPDEQDPVGRAEALPETLTAEESVVETVEP
jgi:pilus assembly protein CpaB